jgi:hypothetical protein
VTLGRRVAINDKPATPDRDSFLLNRAARAIVDALSSGPMRLSDISADAHSRRELLASALALVALDAATICEVSTRLAVSHRA